MSSRLLLEYALFAETICACAVFLILCSKGLTGKFSYLAAFAGVHCLSTAMRVALLFFRVKTGLSLPVAYEVYFYGYWTSAFVEQALLLMLTYQIFYRAMLPFKGLSRLGTLVFKWVSGVAIVITLGSVVIPGHLTDAWFVSTAGRIEQGVSVLTICLMLFVTFAIRHLGTTYRSHLFGSSLGLGILGTASLFMSAWYAAHPTPSIYAPMYLISAIGTILTLGVWGTYFLLPEPKRQMVLIPTTSPYFHWNQISEVLGNDPGMVAVAGFTPDSLSPAERLVLGASPSRGARSAARVRVSGSRQPVAAGSQR